jgi:S-adenosylmethionine decarboxylase
MQQQRYHVIMDLENVSQEILNDVEGLREFLKKLPGTIDMSVLKGPEVVQGIPENPGITGFVIIDFSHISVHTFTKFGEALVDIFSCKPFEQENAIKAVLEYFKISREDARIKEVFWG